mmetsp:Transcript_23665/g.80024  ORF Transcript_23665/g.80024 Transcript_23665/m.80024 type:complete len:206 (+) Transcript_23665:75-692(+)
MVRARLHQPPSATRDPHGSWHVQRVEGLVCRCCALLDMWVYNAVRRAAPSRYRVPATRWATSSGPPASGGGSHSRPSSRSSVTVAPLDPVDVLVVGERLEPDCALCLAWLQRDGREEDAFPSEKHRLDAPRQLDAVVQVLGEGHQAARIHADRGPLRSQLLGENGSTSLEDDHALARDLLQDEGLASEECGAQPLPEARGDRQGV